MKAVAKKDVKVLMEDGRFSDFRAGNTYRCMQHNGNTVLMDEQKCGFICDEESFNEDFELIQEI